MLQICVLWLIKSGIILLKGGIDMYEGYLTLQSAIDSLQDMINNAEEMGLYDEDVDSLKWAIEIMTEKMNEQNCAN